MAENLYSDSFSFGPLYPQHADQSPNLSAPASDFTSRYRAQAELLRRTGEVPSQQPQQQQQYENPQTWGWDQSGAFLPQTPRLRLPC